MKLGARIIPNNAEIPVMISIPPEKSAYCCAEYKRIPKERRLPGFAAIAPSRILAIGSNKRSAMAYFFRHPNKIRKKAFAS